MRTHCNKIARRRPASYPSVLRAVARAMQRNPQLSAPYVSPAFGGGARMRLLHVSELLSWLSAPADVMAIEAIVLQFERTAQVLVRGILDGLPVTMWAMDASGRVTEDRDLTVTELTALGATVDMAVAQ